MMSARCLQDCGPRLHYAVLGRKVTRLGGQVEPGLSFVVPTCRQEMSEGKVQYVPCSPGEKGAFEATLIKLAEDGKAAAVQPPVISMRDFQKVRLLLARESGQDEKTSCPAKHYAALRHSCKGLQLAKPCGVGGSGSCT